MRANRNVRAVMIGVGRVHSQAVEEVVLAETVVDLVPVVVRVQEVRPVARGAISVDLADTRTVVDLVVDNFADRSRRAGVRTSVVTITAIKGRVRRTSRVSKW